MKKNKKITLGEILQSEGNSNGYGLFGHDVRRPSFWTISADPYAVVKLIDETVVQLANKKRWNVQKTFEFMDSKLGRWAGDEISAVKVNYPTNKEIAAILNKYMTKFES
ncbi:MAG: hypothetical protein AB7G93_11405 [Bdellovibrionales bacterium]